MLDRDQCLALLATLRIGRVVYTSRGLPAVQPVRFVVREDSVCFQAPADSALFAAACDGVVAFEADMFDAELTAGWCVTALGRANEAREPALVKGLPELRWKPSARDCDDRYIRLPIEVVSGRLLCNGQ